LLLLRLFIETTFPEVNPRGFRHPDSANPLSKILVIQRSNNRSRDSEARNFIQLQYVHTLLEILEAIRYKYIYKTQKKERERDKVPRKIVSKSRADKENELRFVSVFPPTCYSPFRLFFPPVTGCFLPRAREKVAEFYRAWSALKREKRYFPNLPCIASGMIIDVVCSVVSPFV